MFDRVVILEKLCQRVLAELHHDHPGNQSHEVCSLGGYMVAKIGWCSYSNRPSFEQGTSSYEERVAEADSR